MIPSSPVPPDIAAYEFLDMPVAVGDGQGRVLAANGAFAHFTGYSAAACATRVIDELLCGPATDPAQRLWIAKRLRTKESFAPVDFTGHRADGTALHARLSLRFLDGNAGCVAMLQPRAQQRQLEANVERLAEMLDMAQDYGRIGVWERDVRTLEGHWDRHVWRFWGLAPGGGGSLPFDQALQSVVQEDRADIERLFKHSTQRAGEYSQRFRLVDAQGTMRHVRSQWEVRAGPDGIPERALGILMDDTEAFQLAQTYGETHAQLRLAMDLADIMIWRYDTRQQRLFGNERGWAMLERPVQAEGVPGMAMRRLIHRDDLADVMRRMRQATAQDGPVEIAARLNRRTGDARYLLTRCIAQRGEHGELTGFLGVSLDLSERFEQSRREMELARRLEMATSAAGVAIWTQSLLDNQGHWDEQMRLLHGGGEAVVAGGFDEYLSRYVHPDDQVAVRESIRSLHQRKSGMVDLDFRVRRPDGTIRRVASRTSIEAGKKGITLYGVMLDVTERHAAEHQLREATERASLATRGAGIGTWETDLAGELGHWDEQMFRLRGREPSGRLVTSAERMSWVHPADREAAQLETEAAVAEDRATNHVFRVIWPDGSVHWLASRSTPVRDDAGRTIRRIGINWDITDARAAAEAQEEIRLAQEKSRAKSQFLARMSHELRTPLNAVLGFSQLLLADGAAQDSATLEQRAGHIHAAGKHLLTLINDVLDLSSLESGERPLQASAVPLQPLLKSVLPLVENMARQHRVSLHVADMSLSVRADAMRLRQVLINLLSNAIKYNRPGGEVRVSAQSLAGQVRIDVRDSGRGMSPEQLQQVFEPFNRLGMETEGIDGTGIGLAIVHASMQRMGGSVQVESEAGSGSRFSLVLPLAALESPVPADSGFAPLGPPPADTGRSKRLLYIEDNPVNSLIVSELVGRRRDLQFESAPDGRSGIARARQTRPDLILVDMQLPDIDGHEVLRGLRSDPATAAIRCVALSANAMPDDIRRALSEGFDDYWTKPLDFKRFFGALDAMFGPQA